MNFFRFATRRVGSFYIVDDTINLIDRVSRISVFLQSGKTAVVTIAGTVVSLGTGGTTST